MDIKCKNCNRFLFKQVGTVVIENFVCGKCGAIMNFKIINADHEKDIRYKFTTKEVLKKEKKDEGN